MHGRKKLLKTRKAFFSLDLYQRVFVPLPRFMPAPRNQGSIALTSSCFSKRNPDASISCSLTPGGTNRKRPIELHRANSSLVTGPVITTGSESLLTNCVKDLFGEMAVGAVKEINAFCHVEDLSSIESGLITQVATKRMEMMGSAT